MFRKISRRSGRASTWVVLSIGLIAAAFSWGSAGMAKELTSLIGPMNAPLAPLSSNLWYNGNMATEALPNGRNFAGFPNAKVYSDFVVTSATGWYVSEVSSNNLFTIPPVTSAEYEIRQGVGVGTSGTLVASGSATDDVLAPGQPRDR